MVQISAWQRCPPNPIRRLAEITQFQNPQCTQYISAEKSQATVPAAAEVLASDPAIAQSANLFRKSTDRMRKSTADSHGETESHSRKVTTVILTSQQMQLCL